NAGNCAPVVMMDSFVLVVDDDPDIRDVICELLEEKGYTAVGVPNGQVALEILRGGNRPSVILLDMTMPVVDGPTFRAAQLQNPRFRAIPVVVITAAWSDDAARTLNPFAILRKPFDTEALLKVVGHFRPRSP